MKNLAASALLAGGVLGALLGFAGPSNAAVSDLSLAGPVATDLSDLTWVLQNQQRAYVPHVDNSIRHSR